MKHAASLSHPAAAAAAQTLNHRRYGDLTIDECMDLWERCGCEGDCTMTSSQGECNKGACVDLYASFNSQLLFFCPPWITKDTESGQR